MELDYRIISSEEDDKWEKIHQLRRLDSDFDCVVSKLEKDCFDRRALLKKDAEQKLMGARQRFEAERNKILESYLSNKASICQARNDAILEKYDEWIKTRSIDNVRLELFRKQYYVSLRQYLMWRWIKSKLPEEKLKDVPPLFSENFTEDKILDVYRRNFKDKSQTSIDDKTRSIREKLYDAIDIVIGKPCGHELLSLDKRYYLTTDNCLFFDMLLDYDSDEDAYDHDILGSIKENRAKEIDENVKRYIKEGMRSLQEIPGSQLSVEDIEERIESLFGNAKDEAMLVYGRIGEFLNFSMESHNWKKNFVFYTIANKYMEECLREIILLAEKVGYLGKNANITDERIGDYIEINYTRLKTDEDT